MERRKEKGQVKGRRDGWQAGRKEGRKGILEDLLARGNTFPNWNHFSCFIK